MAIFHLGTCLKMCLSSVWMKLLNMLSTIERVSISASTVKIVDYAKLR